MLRSNLRQPLSIWEQFQNGIAPDFQLSHSSVQPKAPLNIWVRAKGEDELGFQPNLSFGK